MKKWIQKFIDQLEGQSETAAKSPSPSQPEISDELGTLLFVLDVMSKHVIETESQPARRVRETLDGLAKEILRARPAELENILFRVRQSLSSQRVEESTFVQKSFDELRKIIWELVENLSHEFASEKKEESVLDHSLAQLREAVEANSMAALKTHSREFIQNYIQVQSSKQNRRVKRAEHIKRNLNQVKKQLAEANTDLRTDHLTQACNRKTFDEARRQHWSVFQITKQNMTLVLLDVDFFKKINDTYGHGVGDVVLVELVKMMKAVFNREADTIARIGGEEFCVLLPDLSVQAAQKKTEEFLARVRGETIVDKDLRVKFTVSAGVATLLENENPDQWLKRADAALYASKTSGRDRCTLAEPHKKDTPQAA